MRSGRDRRRRRKNAGAAGQPTQIYVREAGRRRRPWLTVGLLVLVAGAAALYALAEGQSPQSEQTVRLTDAGKVLASSRADALARKSTDELRRWLRIVPPRRVQRGDRSVVVLKVDRRRLLRRTRGVIRAGGGEIAVPRRAISGAVRLPVFKQQLRNNCETAALSMLLVARGRRIPQLSLQGQLSRSAPLDPATKNGQLVWGDPSRGFVGRPDGGGPAGGYGVYQQPISALARRHGVTLRDLSGRQSASIFRALSRGRPVMVWVGLSDGPFRTWSTRTGRRVTGNFGEHTVVLTGFSGKRLNVNDPLSGRRLTWTRSQFEVLWQRLGRRALAL